jgi:predicted nucleotidyltransferase
VETIRAVLHPFADRIERAGLFGSRATGTWKPASDIDLILYGPVSDAEVDRIRTLLLDSDLPVPVDVIAYPSIEGTALQRHIDHVVQVLLTRDELRADGQGRDP